MRQPYPPSHRTNAFTLIEVAVVLVIIGLLVGGIAYGQRMIRSSELSSMMVEAKSYQLAYSQFQEKYAAVPGDFVTASSVWPTATNGDGNGIIRAGTSNNAELFLAFQHLSLAGLIEGSYSGTGAGSIAGTNVPRSSVSGTAYLLDHPNTADGGVSGDTYFFDGMYGHVLYVGGLSVSGPPLRPTGGFLTPEEAFSLDQKYDDGNPGLGIMLAPKQSALANCASSDVTTATYLTSGNSATCMFVLKQP